MPTNEILELIFGTKNLPQLLVGIGYSFFGAILSLLIESNTRYIPSTKSPIKYSYKYLIIDNSKRLLTTLFLIIVFMRFSKELLGIELTVYISFIIGFCSDKLSEILKKFKRNLLSKQEERE